jgi:RHS repeat-associated protein
VAFTYDKGGRITQRKVRLGNGNAWTGGDVITTMVYAAGGRLSTVVTNNGGSYPANTWYSFGPGGYNAVDDLTGYAETVYGPGSRSLQLTYSTDGTRRLGQFNRVTGNNVSDTYTHDTFGNKVTQLYTGPGDKIDNTTACAINDTLIYSTTTDNRLLKRVRRGCVASVTYFTDQAGNRLAELDSLPGQSTLPIERLAYTAGGHLYFSFTRTSTLGSYDANWHWYDGGGRRVVSQALIASSFSSGLEPTQGNRTFYVYDGNDVAMTVLRGTDGSWSVRQRFVTGGLDEQLAVRSVSKNIVLVGDRAGSTLVGVNNTGAVETQTSYWVRDAFGNVDQFTGATSINTETGFTGASTPNSSGGFTYLRNRWYDPRTGSFLTQDPIGLAGGVNLYAYAGNNPIAFSDPFGLCPHSPCRDNPGTIVYRALKRLNDDLNRDLQSLLKHPEAMVSDGGLEYGEGRLELAEGVALLRGRHGGPEHRAVIAEEAATLVRSGATILAGGRRLPERAVEVGGGRIRYPDIIALQADGSMVYVNVGRQTKAGMAIAREARALSDLLGTGVGTRFVPYNK